MGVLDKFKDLKETFSGKQKTDEEKKQEEIKTVAKEIEGEYKEAIDEEGRRQAIEKVAKIINERITDPNERRIIDETLKDFLNELKEHTAIPVNEVAPNLVKVAIQSEEQDPKPILEATAEVAGNETLVKIIEKEEIPLEHKNILVEGISDEQKKEKALKEIKSEEETQKEKEDIAKLKQIYEDCKNIPDAELASIIKNMELNRNNEEIENKIFHIVAKKMVQNYNEFSGIMWYTASKIIPIEEMYAGNIEGFAQEEFEKEKEEQKEKKKTGILKLKKQEVNQENKGKNQQKDGNAGFSKEKLSEELEKQLIDMIVNRYQEVGDWQIPNSQRMKNRSEKEIQRFIKGIETAQGKSLTKMQEKTIRAKMSGIIIDDTQVRKFQDIVIEEPQEKRNAICNLGIEMASKDNKLYNTIMMAKQQGVLDKLVAMPKEYRDQCLSIISQALDKELAQFLKNSEEKGKNNKGDKQNLER